MGNLLQDLRTAVRALVKRPGFTLVAATSIAIGIGFNAAIFSAINVMLLRPVPGIGQPERVVEVGRTDGGHGFDSFSYPDFLDLRESVPELSEVVAWRIEPLSYGSEEGGERVIGMAVSPGYFAAMGASPRGRDLGPEEDLRNGPAVVVVSDRFWRERLTGAPDVIGRAIDINRTPFTIIGVAPPGFAGHVSVVSTDLWVPISRMDVVSPGFNPESYERRHNIFHQVLARLAPGVSIERAEASVGAVMGGLAEAYPASNEGRSATLLPLGPVPGGGRSMITAFFGALMALVALILVVASANVAGMLLARGAAREKEIAIRLAIGSGRARLVRQLVAESLVLFVVGAAGGLALAWWGTSLVTGISGPGMDIALDLTPDATVLLFALGLALVTGLGFGLVPALQVSRPELTSALKDEGRRGPRGTRTRRLFVAVQVGLSLILMAAGGLLVRSLMEAHRASVGFDPAGIHMTTIDLSLDGYSSEEVVPFQASLLRALRVAPGVTAAALAQDLPMDLSEHGGPAWPDGWEDPEGRGLGTDFNAVSSGYFETLRIPLHRGRSFSDDDRADADPVAIVSEAFAREAWGDADPIGRQLRWGSLDATPRTVVGVVGEVKNQTLGESVDGMVYLPLSQRPTPNVSVLARGPGLAPSMLRRILLQADPQLALGPPQTLARITSTGLLPARVAAYVAALLGVIGLFLSALGIYGLVAHGVAQRRREIGIRMAVGAGAAQVLRLVVGGGLRVALPGLVIGGLAAFAVARLMRGMLFGVSPGDPLTFAAAAALLIGAVVLASWLPARRAAAVDPIEALRAD